VIFQGGAKKQLDQIIEQKCKLLGKTGINKGSLLHLQQWMTGQLGTYQTDSPITPEVTQFKIAIQLHWPVYFYTRFDQDCL